MSMINIFTTRSLSVGKWRWLCLVLAWAATLGILIGLLCGTLQILFPAAWPHLFPASWEIPPVKLHNELDISAVPLPYRVGILACESVSAGLGVWALWSMRQLFLGFARGEVFTARALRYLNHIALALLLGEIADFLALAPDSLLATWSLGHGHREISLSFSGDDMASLFLAGAAFVIARVMAEARRIADDNASIV